LYTFVVENIEKKKLEKIHMESQGLYHLDITHVFPGDDDATLLIALVSYL